MKQWFYSKLYYQLTKQAANTNGASPLKNSFYRNEVNGRIKRHWEEGLDLCFGTLVNFILQFICGYENNKISLCFLRDFL